MRTCERCLLRRHHYRHSIRAIFSVGNSAILVLAVENCDFLSWLNHKINTCFLPFGFLYLQKTKTKLWKSSEPGPNNSHICMPGFGHCQYCHQLFIIHSYWFCVLTADSVSSPPVWVWLRLCPAEIMLLVWVPSSYFSPTLVSLIWSLCIPVIDPRQEAQMGSSGAKEQRQYLPLLQSVGWHTLLLAKCLLFCSSLLSC